MVTSSGHVHYEPAQIQIHDGFIYTRVVLTFFDISFALPSVLDIEWAHGSDGAGLLSCSKDKFVIYNRFSNAEFPQVYCTSPGNEWRPSLHLCLTVNVHLLISLLRLYGIILNGWSSKQPQIIRLCMII
jgi:hypothetical protein